FSCAASSRFITSLYRLNFLRINGCSFHDPKKLWERKNRYPHFFSLHITNRCNFSCRYCYNDSSPARTDMALETSKFIIKKLLLEIPLPSITVEFHGGEPMLLFEEVIVPAVQYGESLSSTLGKKIRFLMQTNGSLISKRTADFITKHDMGVGISCDGNEALQNRNRVFCDGRGTYEATLKGIRNLFARRKRAGTLATIERPEDYSSVIQHAAAHGIHDISIRPVYPLGRAAKREGISDENASSFAGGFLKAVDLIVKLNREWSSQEQNRKPEGEKMIFRNLCTYIELLISKERTDMCYRSPCGAGNSITGFDTGGDLYPCEEMTGIENLRMGNIHDSESLLSIIVDSPAYRSLNERNVEKLAGCGRCKWMHICGGGCISKITAADGDPEQGDYYCGFNRTVLEELALRLSFEPSLAQLLLNTRHLETSPVDSSLWRLSLQPERIRPE
ncbi:MAG: radical SAM protein, partial [Vulcanimicrobiota bacterium]